MGNSLMVFGTESIVVSSSTPELLIQFNRNLCRSAKIVVQCSTADSYQVSEIMLMHVSGDVHQSEYGILYNDQLLGSFDSSVSGDNVQLFFESLVPGSVNVVAHMTAIRDV